MTFPPSTRPIEVTLTRPVDDIPRQRRRPDGQPQLAYELKIDGWRLVLSKTRAGAVELWSRHGCNLTTAFPELATAALEHLAPGTVVHGEVCVLGYVHLDWDRLQRRLGSRALVADEARRAPASYVAFRRSSSSNFVMARTIRLSASLRTAAESALIHRRR